jgi:Protein of unknown function (DUF935)
MPKSRGVVADFQDAVGRILTAPRVTAARRPSTATTLKGNALAPRGIPASRQAAPAVGQRVTPNSTQRRGAPSKEAYGPPLEEFQTPPPKPIDAVAQSDTASEALAPRPIVDKFPVVIGAGNTFAYLSACQRTALTGYRMQYVDLAREILERDPHLYAVVWKVIRGLANGRLEITPAKLPEGHKDVERAKKIADDIRWRLTLIRGLKQSLATLGWGAYYGVGASELHYKHSDDFGWYVDHLGFIHSRRLSYPDTGSWDLYIWDQGQVLSAAPYGTNPTNANIFGLRVGDYPYKFMVFAPQISGDYPTREGLSRLVLEWALSKRLNARVALQYLERFVKPWPEAKYNTKDPDDKIPTPRIATEEDILEASNAMAMLGVGGLSSWVHPDSVEVNLKSADEGRPKLTFKEFLNMCNEELSKGCVGGTLTTSGGSEGGNRSLGTEHKAEEVNIVQFLADVLAESCVKEQLVAPMVLLNEPDAAHLIPNVSIHVEDVDPEQLMKLATEGSKCNIHVDGDKVAEMVGLPVVAREEGEDARRMMPLDVTLPTDLDPELAPEPPPGTKAGAALENEKTKAQQPHLLPGAALPAPGDGASKGTPAPKTAKPAPKPKTAKPAAKDDDT